MSINESDIVSELIIYKNGYFDRWIEGGTSKTLLFQYLISSKSSAKPSDIACNAENCPLGIFYENFFLFIFIH